MENMLRWIKEYESIWLFSFLLLGLIIELHSSYMLRKEYDYDKAKDDKRKKKTTTTKKTVKNLDGSSTVEEQIQEEIGGEDKPNV